METTTVDAMGGNCETLSVSQTLSLGDSSVVLSSSFHGMDGERKRMTVILDQCLTPQLHGRGRAAGSELSDWTLKRLFHSVVSFRLSYPQRLISGSLEGLKESLYICSESSVSHHHPSEQWWNGFKGEGNFLSTLLKLDFTTIRRIWL